MVHFTALPLLWLFRESRDVVVELRDDAVSAEVLVGFVTVRRGLLRVDLSLIFLFGKDMIQ